MVSGKADAISIINTPEEKYRLLHRFGIENIIVVPFDAAFAEQTAEDYIADFLVEQFHPHTIIIGYDHKFGNNRTGNYQLLERKAPEFNYQVKEIPGHVLADVTISSTRIRKALLEGDVNSAASLLGYEYFFTGLVTEGNKLGRTIGYPTANLLIENDEKLIPANGVYAVKVALEGEDDTYHGMMNIGIRPTINGTNRVIEVNIFDFDRSIYGRHLQVKMVQRLRDEVKFAGLDALKNQLALDKEAAEAALSG